jgi:dolichyl-phosphate-mannose--protein O-mannosyl transferase
MAPVTSAAPQDFDAVAGLDRPSLPVRIGSRLDDLWERLMVTPRRRRWWNVGAPIAIVVLAAILRLVNLGHPGTIIFDETFYVKDAWSQWHLGYPGSWPADADASFAKGDVDIFLKGASFVVHPPLGKWLIGLPMVLFGPEHAWTWRLAAALAGIAGVALLMLAIKKLMRSTLLVVIGGLLFAIDGNAIVMSRVGLLDNFVMLFALVGFICVLYDRGYSERRLSDWMARRRLAGRSTDWGPALWGRPWLFAAGAAFGFASAVKWNGLYFLAVFAVYTVLSDVLARRRAGVGFPVTGTVLRQAPATFLIMVPIALAAYMSTWITWFTTKGGYDRTWAESPTNQYTGFWSWVPRSVQSFIHYEQDVYRYNIGESRPHPYQANPLTWLFEVRPTSMYYESYGVGQNGCTSNCGESITELANPLIWWAATVACLYLVYRLVRYREWRVGLILTGMLAGYVPWLQYTNRTVFQFYTIAFEPYMLLALVFVIGIVLGSRRDLEARRRPALITVGVYLSLVALLSIFYWPLWTGTMVPYWFLRLHWWFPSWV